MSLEMGIWKRRVTYSEISFGTSILDSARQGCANLLSQRMLAAGAGNFAVGQSVGGDILRSLPQCIPFKLD